MLTIEETRAATPMFRNLTDDQLMMLADLAEDVEFGEGGYLMIEGQAADWFFVIREGFVALQTEAPSGPITIETLHNGDPVGWSWLFDPYLAHFDALSRGTTRAIRFDASTLRGRFDGRSRPGLRADAQLRRRDRRASAGDPAPATRRLWPRSCQLSRSRPRAR